MKINRKIFLKLAGMAGAGMIVKTGQAGKSDPFQNSHVQKFNMQGYAAPKLNTVRIGFIGVGSRGSGHVTRFNRIEGVEVKAICDLVPERVKDAVDSVKSNANVPDSYTNSEERIGKAITGWREGLILATKTAARSRQEAESHLKLSLGRLGVEYIDLYQLHNVSDAKAMKAIFAPDGPLAVAEKAKRAGVVKHIGVTSHSIDIAKELVKTGRFESVMFPFNFVTSEPAIDLLSSAREHDVGFIAMKPLVGGRLDNDAVACK